MPLDYLDLPDTTPLLWSSRRSQSQEQLPYYRHEERDDVGALQHKDISGKDAHAQFCALTGCPPSDLKDKDKFHVPKISLYGRTVSQLSSQRRAYNMSAALNNLLLLSQVILGAALTALGASESSHILITLFGATNTVIAGLVAYLKSRGQPMRARMYRDDLERLVDEIENSEIMWRGISAGVHGYDDIDTDEVTVRSEVARLTRLYDRAIRLNGMNNPDMYMAGAGGGVGSSTGGRAPRGGVAPQGSVIPAATPAAPQPSADNAGPAVPLVDNPEDASPATKADVKDDKPKDDKPKDDKPKEAPKDESKVHGKKPATDGAADESDSVPKSAASQPSNSGAGGDQPSSSDTPAPEPVPAQSEPSGPSQAQEQPLLDEINQDLDAAPATAAFLKPKKRNSADGPGSGGKVPGDDD